MKSTKDILAILLSGIFIFGFVLCIYFIGNWPFFFIGLGIMLPFIIWLAVVLQQAKNLRNKNKKRIESLKLNGQQIVVNLLEAKIASNTWTETEITAPRRIVALDNLVGQGHRHVKKVDYHKNLVTFIVELNGETLHLQTELDKEPTSLKMNFAIQKQTVLYVDKHDTDNYYLDLEFLN